MFARSSVWWQVVENEGQPAGYALYRMNSAFERGLQTGSVAVIEAMGDSPEATRAIWRYLFDIDWLARVKAWLLPLDHPLLLMVAEPRRLGFSLRDGLWVRVLDVKAALSARSYQAQGSLVIEITDEFCPWNAGRWKIGSDRVERTDEAPGLRCDITALGSVYLSGFTWTQLARALRVTELVSGAIALADTIFQTPRSPWCPEIF
jgi:predicted acetyltransferase